ncbi:MAG: hypothetical protein ACYSR3_01505 [Planctomycetota bacterium]|jgi:hypothetical protein
MGKKAIICLCLVFLFPVSTYARRYAGTHFIIESNLDYLLVECVQKKSVLFYRHVYTSYSLPGWTFPINIYYSKDESQTNRLLSKYGFIYLKGNSYYITGSPAIYIHKFDDNGQPVDNTSLLIKGITQHFITENLQGAPEWFIEGLSSFFAEQGDIINGKLIVSDPSPNTSLALMEKIDKGSRPNVKQLYGMTAEQLHGLPYGCHFARQLFYILKMLRKMVSN